MSKKSRLVMAIVLIEVILGGIWLYLALMGLRQPGSVTADFQETLGRTMGMAMGGLLGFGILMFFVAASNDRKAAQAAQKDRR